MTTSAPPQTLPQLKVSLQEFHGASVEEWSEFVGSCRIEFLRNPSAYPTDGEKVAMALSLFRGDALRWINTKSDAQLGSYLGSWGVFMTALQTQFGVGDDLLKGRSRQTLEGLVYNPRDPVPFFADARTNLDMMGMTSDASSVNAVWHRIPNNVKESLVARGTPFPSWLQLRSAAIAMSTIMPPANKGRKPKCAKCGKRHPGECRSKN